MPMTIKVTCDGCGTDITTRTNVADYRLVLGSETKPGYGAGVYTSMAIPPPVDRAYYFCDLGCLDHWRSREHHETSLRMAWWDKWREERGTRGSDGRFLSYPTPAHEVQKACDEEFKAAALVAFPMQRPKRKASE